MQITIKEFSFNYDGLHLTLSTPGKQAVGGRPPRYTPAPLLPRGHRSALRCQADGNVAAVSHGQHVSTPTAAAA